MLNPAQDTRSELLAESLRQMAENKAPRAVVIQTHVGGHALELIEWWQEDGILHVAVAGAIPPAS